MADNIFRQPTDEEKKNFIPLSVTEARNQDLFSLFNERLIKVEQQCVKSRIPFCRNCARIDFKKTVQDTIKEREETVYETDPDKFKIKVPTEKELKEKYADPNYFNFIKETDALAPTTGVAGTLVRQIKTGTIKDFQCKRFAHGISIEMDEQIQQSAKITGQLRSKGHKSADKAK